MTVFAYVITFFLLSEIRTAKSVEKFEQASVDFDTETLFSRGRALEQSVVVSREAQQRQTWIRECSEATIGAQLDILEGTILTTFNASTVTLCCEVCRVLYTCTSWRRNRTSGACELINAQQATYLRVANDFDVGGFLGEEIEIETDAGSGDRPIGECPRTRGIIYPNGSVLRRERVPSSLVCCESCRQSSDCNSWYYNNWNRMCALNRDTPAARSAPDRFQGGSF